MKTKYNKLKSKVSKAAMTKIFLIATVLGLALFMQNSLYIPTYLEPMSDSTEPNTTSQVSAFNVEAHEFEVVPDSEDSNSNNNNNRATNGPQVTSEQTINVTQKSPFEVPPELRKKVDFWKQIYGTYSSEYGIIHDSKNVDVIYSIVDFTPITRSKLHAFTKEHRIKAKIETEKTKVVQLLKSLKKGKGSTLSSYKKLTINEKRIFDYFKTIKSKSKYDDAIENMRFQLGQKDFIEKAFYYSGFYLEDMEKTFLKANLPIELTRIPFVESSFNIMARSRVGASGIWQIMPVTGKKLMPNRFVDYRNDPLKATEFAASYLKFNYKVLKAWPLAITAYNHGPTSMLKISKKYKTNDLSLLIKKAYGTKAFGFASTNFYTCFLAILEVEKNQKDYFPNLVKGSPKMFTKVNLKKPMTFKKLVQVFNNDTKKLETYNPHLTSVAKNTNLAIPKGTTLYFPASAPTAEMAAGSKNSDYNQNL